MVHSEGGGGVSEQGRSAPEGVRNYQEKRGVKKLSGSSQSHTTNRESGLGREYNSIKVKKNAHGIRVERILLRSERGSGSVGGGRTRRLEKMSRKRGRKKGGGRRGSFGVPIRFNEAWGLRAKKVYKSPYKPPLLGERPES